MTTVLVNLLLFAGCSKYIFQPMVKGAPDFSHRREMPWQKLSDFSRLPGGVIWESSSGLCSESSQKLGEFIMNLTFFLMDGRLVQEKDASFASFVMQLKLGRLQVFK